MLIDIGEIDGPLLAEQRAALIEVANTFTKPAASPSDFEIGVLLGGLVELLDRVADQLHDEHGCDCLINERTAQRFLAQLQEKALNELDVGNLFQNPR